ncbi:MAG: hypothetical protein ICV83_13615 [Cytophagales bacterium]|nr:hypothetical protein [Cytophagales bacterium]
MSISFRTFYEELSPYGGWITHPAYGSVWVPDAGRDFQPYGTNGYWVMTEYGNTWVSDYPWGWAPFHYGRWFYDDYYGWAWVPGPEWGPAWVAWRSGGGYYGWAPLGPGVNIDVNIVIPARHWVFVPQRYITYHQPYRYCAPRHQVVNIYHNSVHIHNTYRTNNQVYVSGPHRDDIARATRREVPVYRVEEARRPGRTAARNGALEVYRPRVTPEAPAHSRPSRGETYANDRGGRPYEAPAQRPSRGSVTPYETDRSGRTVPAQPRPSGERTPEEGYRESRNYPGGTARPQRVPGEMRSPGENRTEYPNRAPRETGGYGRGPESGRTGQPAPPEGATRGGRQAQPEPATRGGQPAQPGPSGRGRQPAGPEQSTRSEQQRPARQPAARGESSGAEGATGYGRPRRG